MKKHFVHQEILLRPSSDYFKKEWCEINPEKNKNKKLSDRERVLELIWNGVLPELLPEIYLLNEENRPLILWEIYETPQWLELNLGDTESFPLDRYSINPGAIAHFACLN
ncbi:MAG TPA: hypothetical protein PLU07_06230 [Ferruginibacter sp.]|nr:hypothetical protein [Ferruginibacter sp.]HRO17764.1 hypothetical protein [Ferruginibacter sp.]